MADAIDLALFRQVALTRNVRSLLAVSAECCPMTERKPAKRHLKAHEADRGAAPNGLPLAIFGQRVVGYFIDPVLAIAL
jgi:hypothetical protein